MEGRVTWLISRLYSLEMIHCSRLDAQPLQMAISKSSAGTKEMGTDKPRDLGHLRIG